MNVEIPSLSVSDMRRLKATDCVGTYTLFQETYHRPTFKHVHVRGPKSDYDHRLLTHDRAMRAGLDDVGEGENVSFSPFFHFLFFVSGKKTQNKNLTSLSLSLLPLSSPPPRNLQGIGVLFGLADYRYEVLAMIQHAVHLEREYNAGPHTISVPRMRHAEGSDVSDAPPCPVDDANFKKLVAILRIAVPYTGMILSTRESPEMRRELLKCGMSQMSAGSRYEWRDRGVGFCFFCSLSSTSTQKHLSPSRKTDQQDRSRCLPPRRKPSRDQRQALAAQRTVFAHGEKREKLLSFFFFLLRE